MASNKKESAEDSASSDHIWGILTPIGVLGSAVPTKLTSDMVTIGRLGDVEVDNSKVSKIHCRLRFNRNNGTVHLLDLSSNGTFIFEKAIPREGETIIHDGDIIRLLNDPLISFVLTVTNPKHIQQKITLSGEGEEKQSSAEQQMKSQLENFKKEDARLENDVACVICMEIMYTPYMLIPCLHNYCCDCLSKLVNTKSFSCPQCRVQPTSVQRNYQLNNIINAYLNKYPEKRWTIEVQESKEKGSLFTPKFLESLNKKLSNKTRKLSLKRRIRGDDDDEEDWNDESSEYDGEEEEEDDEEEDFDDDDEEVNFQRQNVIQFFGRGSMLNQLFINPSFQPARPQFVPAAEVCFECNQRRQDDGFKCSTDQKHAICKNCDGRLPIRDDQPINCEICEAYYCNLYKQKECPSKYQSTTVYHLRQFKDLPIPLTLAGVLAGNDMEIKVLKDFLPDDELRTTLIYDYMMEKEVNKGKFVFEQSSKFMKMGATSQQSSKMTRIDRDSLVCTMCWPEIWRQLVLKYRIHVKQELPENVQKRQDCWSGINCQQTSRQHLVSFSHACPQTKF